MVAVSGALLVGFLIVHASGNLLILKGPDALNTYADWLQGHPLLWGFRAGLVALLLAHVVTAARLAHENRAARPLRYRHLAHLGTRLPGRLMVFSGLGLLAFIVFHLLHLTMRAVGPLPQPLHDAAGRLDVHGMVVAGFSDPLIALLYLVAMVLLALHLWHAIESMLQTLGFHHDNYQPAIRLLAPALSLLIAAGFAAIPLLVLGGWLGGGG